MRRLIALAVVSALFTAGCVDQGGLDQLQGSIDDRTVEWGEAAQFTIRNVGEGKAPAPITVKAVSANGTVVRTWEDVTAGRGIPPNGQVSLHWNGLNEEGRPVLWGNYTFQVEDSQAQGIVQLLRPPNFALDVDPDPRETETGDSVTFTVSNDGNVWLNGSLTVAAGRQDNILYNNTVDHVELPPGGHYNMTWNGQNPDGEDPEPQRYLVAARMELDNDGPTPFSQDWFELTGTQGT